MSLNFSRKHPVREKSAGVLGELHKKGRVVWGYLVIRGCKNVDKVS
jgi:hypothetical protein